MGAADDEHLRLEAAGWFARMRGPQGQSVRADFDLWRGQSAAHQRAYDRMVRQWEASAVLGNSQVPGLRLIRTPARRASSRLMLTGAIAAALMAAAGLATWLSSRGAAWMPLVPQQYATAVGEIRAIALPGGQSLILDTDSVASRHLQNGQSLISLRRGRARLVTTGPMTIEAAGAQIRVQGGAVDLALSGDNTLDVSALSALVEVQSRGRPVQLRPGQHIILAALRSTAPAPTPGQAHDWPSGLAVYDGAPLAEVVAQANRYGGPKLRLDGSELGALKVSGGFKITRTEPLAKSLAAAFGLSLSKAPGGDLVLSRIST